MSSVPSCPLTSCSWAFSRPIPNAQHPTFIRAHLNAHHSHELHTIPNSKFTLCHLYPCRICNTIATTFLRASSLCKHTAAHHATSRPNSNLDLIHTAFPPAPHTISSWNHTLVWLVDLSISPPPFRHTWYHSLTPATRRLLVSTYAHLLDVSLTALLPYHDTDSSPPHLTSTSALFKLLFLFETLILFPDPTVTHLNTEVKNWLADFTNGSIQTLYNRAYALTPPSPPVAIHPSSSTPISTFDHGAQRAADLDNIRTAFQRVDSTLKVASNTPDMISHVTSTLFPARRAPSGHHLRRTSARVLARLSKKPLHLLPNEHALLSALRKIKQATAVGPFADSTNLLHSLALTQRPHSRL